MLRFISLRLLQSLPVFLVVVTATFFLLRIAPGGPFDSERRVTAAVEAQLLAHYRMDQPLYRQYLEYLGNLIRGDLGPSFRYPTRSVGEIIASGLPQTLQLACLALIFALLTGVIAGMIAALYVNSWRDHAAMAVAMVGICMPSFLIGPLLILVLGIYLDLLPVSGWGQRPLDWLLPSITLGSAYAAYIARLTRGGLLETINRDFVRTGYAKGLLPSAVLIRHCLRSALLPVISFLGPAVAGLISGSFVVETLFQIPGIGRFYVQAAFNRDYTMVMGTTVFFAALIILCNMLSEIALAWLDPRIQLQGQK